MQQIIQSNDYAKLASLVEAFAEKFVEMEKRLKEEIFTNLKEIEENTSLIAHKEALIGSRMELNWMEEDHDNLDMSKSNKNAN